MPGRRSTAVVVDQQVGGRRAREGPDRVGGAVVGGRDRLRRDHRCDAQDVRRPARVGQAPRRRPWSVCRALVLVPWSCVGAAATEQPPAGRTAEPPRDRRRPSRWRCTVSVLLPRRLIEASTLALEPVPTATRMITAATPMRMPSVVSADRSLFEVTPSTANLALSRSVHDAPPSVSPRAGGPGARRAVLVRRPTISPSRTRITRLAWAATSCLVRDHHDGPTGRRELVEQGEDLRAAVAVEGARTARRRAGAPGSVTIARAIATFCCWPPESWAGRWSPRSCEADPVERRRAPWRARSAAGTPA